MKILHVTEILGKYVDFSRVPDQALFMASQRGQIVHRVCGAYAVGAYVAGLPDHLVGYFKSFKRWFDANVKAVVLVEKTMVDPTLGFTGRPDLVVELFNGLDLLTDLKTPIAESKTWGVQLSAYWHLCNRYGIRLDGAASLRLKPNGGEAIATRYDNSANDFNVFLSALNAHRYLIG